MSRQSRFDLWSSKNKNDNGFSEKIQDDDFSIKTSKQQEYETLKAQVTDAEKVRMRELLYVSKSQIEFLSRLEDEKINVMYLVALGITTEEDVQSYLTLRDRGIDTYGIQDLAKTKKVNSAYLREIETIKKEYPPLLNIKGKNIQRTLDLENYIKENAVVEKVELTKKKEVKGNVQDDPSVIIDIDSYETNTDEGSTPEEIEKASNWKNLIEEILHKSQTTPDGEKLEKPSLAPLQPSNMFIDIDDSVRNVYILANSFATPFVEGYRFIFIDSAESFGRFSVNKNNLLILTSDVPQYLMNDFGTWLYGVITQGVKFRIATLRTSPLDHAIVQGVLMGLDKESLDNFYATHRTEDYIDESKGSFLDLTSYIEDENTTETD